MRIEFDPEKRAATLANRGLDMAAAGEVFDGPTLTVPDDRQDYGEPRFISIGRLRGRMVVIVWTPRGTARRIISMRKANEREQDLYGPDLD
ncbi:BrnT family toxin [Rhodocista pekingensis]|uniref:BrnT family toxin n=1 Tax=Rhodocista pekingensis TaxID=201185 RepID=A0ABW2KT96_9PROT